MRSIAYHLHAIWLVFAATLASLTSLHTIGARNLSLPFILAVMLAGTWFGLRPALSAAASAFICYNFFLIEPRFSLSVTPADIVALGSFLIAALVVGAMAGKLSDRTRLVESQLERLKALFAASRDLTAAATPQDVAINLARNLKQGGHVDAAIWSCDKGEQSLLATTEGAADPNRNSCLSAGGLRAADVRTLTTSQGDIGLVAIWVDGEATAYYFNDWLDALLQLGTIALDRAKLATEITEVRLVAEREALRTALLSSLSHDLRTPLTAILASTSSLTLYDQLFDQPTRRKLVETIQEQAERLNRYVTNLLDMTRLESGAINLQQERIDPAEVMMSALEHSRRSLAHHRVERSFNTPGMMISVDPVLIEHALVNILENASAFGPQGSIINISVTSEDTEVVFAVADQGIGVGPHEIALIFEKFFRGEKSRQQNCGVGLGLAVTKGIVEAFGGSISVESPICDGKGTRFLVRLPAHRRMELRE